MEFHILYHFDNYSTFFAQLYGSTEKGLYIRNSGDNSQWFVIKKIKLICASDRTPVVKFKIDIIDEGGFSTGDSVIVEVSNDNRETWESVYVLDKDNYEADDYLNKFKDEIVSLHEYKNDVVNIRFRFEYSGSSNFCLIDDIEVCEGVHAKIVDPTRKSWDGNTMSTPLFDGVWDFESYTPDFLGFPVEGDIVDTQSNSVDRSNINEDFKLDTLSMYEFTPDIPINYKYTWPTDSGALPWNNEPLKFTGKSDDIPVVYERMKRPETKASKDTDNPVTWSYERFDLEKPGVYNLIARGYDAEPTDDEYIGVLPDTTKIIIPPWKMKLHGDFLYCDSTYYADGFIPYVEKTEYSKNQDVKVYIWRPFTDFPVYIDTLTITHNGSEIARTNEGIFGSQIFSNQNKTVGLSTETGDSFRLSDGMRWVKSDDQTPGFYQIKAFGYDDSLGVDIVQEKEIQIPPMYYDFEDYPYLWPEGWDKNSSTANPDKWWISRRSISPGDYPLEWQNLLGYYDTYHHVSTSIVTPEITLNETHHTILSAWVSLPREVLDNDSTQWQPLYARYLVQAKINNGAWFTVYEPVQDDYDDYFGEAEGWMNCMRPFFYSLGDSVSAGTKVQLKFVIAEKPEFYTPYDWTWKEQTFAIDDIKIMYTKEEVPEAPTIISATQGDKSNSIIWLMNYKKDSPRTLDTFNVYRDGSKIGTTVETTFIDTAIESNTTYEYAITRKLEDHPTLKETSVFDCNISLTTTELTFPRPQSFELALGTGTEQSNAILSWSPPKTGTIEYDIYRNGSYLNSTTNLTFTDCFLPEGTYSYYVIAKYTTPIGESWATDTKSITVSSNSGSSILPIIESFENNGQLPDGWTYSTYIGHGKNQWGRAS
ncbi:MAG: hypothetical protein JXR69_09810 [Candidatus Delongbacteria bacterium]|nr:hypothetical protein [Candidatus Delongbacteria bacterium]